MKKKLDELEVDQHSIYSFAIGTHALSSWNDPRWNQMATSWKEVGNLNYTSKSSEITPWGYTAYMTFLRESGVVYKRVGSSVDAQ